MKVFNGVIHYTVTEVAQLCGKSTQSVKLWAKNNLIPAPYVAENGYNYWSAADTEKIIQYAQISHKEKYGNMRKKD